MHCRSTGNHFSLPTLRDFTNLLSFYAPGNEIIIIIIIITSVLNTLAKGRIAANRFVRS